MFHIQQWCVQCWVPIVYLQVLYHCKKKLFSGKSYQEPASMQQKACRGEQASTHIVLKSVAGEDNREERFGSLT